MPWFFITYRSEKKWLKSTEGKLNPILREKENFTLNSNKTCSHIFSYYARVSFLVSVHSILGVKYLFYHFTYEETRRHRSGSGVGEGVRKPGRCYLRYTAKKGQSWGLNRPVWLHTTAVLTLIVLSVAMCQVLTS